MLNTDKALLRQLEQARSHVMTPEEEFEQRVSYVWGMLPWGDPRTKDEVREDVRRIEKGRRDGA